MKRFLILISILGLVGCHHPLEQVARDAAAASGGFIAQAQANHAAECKATPAKAFPCQMINQAIGAQGLLIDAIEIYCNGTPISGQRNFANGGPCAPDATAAPKLQASLNNLNQIITDYKRASARIGQARIGHARIGQGGKP